MPENDPVPAGNGVIGGAVQQAGWFARFFASINPTQGQALSSATYMVASLFLIGWLMWQSSKSQEKQQVRDDELMAQYRRDAENNAVKCQADKQQTAKTVLDAWASMDKEHRKDNQSHAKEALDVVSKLEASINRLGKMKIVPEDCPLKGP